MDESTVTCSKVSVFNQSSNVIVESDTLINTLGLTEISAVPLGLVSTVNSCLTGSGNTDSVSP